MKNILLCGLLFTGAGIVAGCANDPIAQSGTNNPNVDVSLLFSHDGCDVFRFRDVGFHYYVRCAAPATNVQTTQNVSCGKNCSREEAIRTDTSSP